jgi:hypothetical protein
MKLPLLAGGLFVLSTVAAAHHSIAGMYDRNTPVTIDGVITEFRFVNPHPFLMVQVAGNGGRETWKLELDNRSELAAVGVKSDTLKPGDRVRATGSRARDGSTSMYALRIDRPGDGFWYEQVGSSPRVGNR